MILAPVCREEFNNIKKTKQQKPCYDMGYCRCYQKKSKKHASDFVDNDTRGVLLCKKNLGAMGEADGQTGKSRRRDQIKGPGEKGDEVIQGDAEKASRSSRRPWQESEAQPRSQDFDRFCFQCFSLSAASMEGSAAKRVKRYDSARLFKAHQTIPSRISSL